MKVPREHELCRVRRETADRGRNFADWQTRTHGTVNLALGLSSLSFASRLSAFKNRHGVPLHDGATHEFPTDGIVAVNLLVAEVCRCVPLPVGSVRSGSRSSFVIISTANTGGR